MSERSSKGEDSRVFSQASGRKSGKVTENLPHFVEIPLDRAVFWPVDEQSHFSGHVTLPVAISLRSASQVTSTANAPAPHGKQNAIGRNCIDINRNRFFTARSSC